MRHPAGKPKMPATPVEPADATWRDRLRHFHVAGGGDDEGTTPLVPASLTGFFDPEELMREYPLVLGGPEADGVARPLAVTVAETLEAMGGGGRPTALLSEHASRLVWAFSRALGEEGRPAPLADTVDRACERFLADFEVSAEAAKALEEEVGRFKQALPSQGLLLGFGDKTLLTLYHAVVKRERGVRLASFVAEARALSVELASVLAVDDSLDPAASAPDALAASLGGGAGFFDSAALSASLPARRGSKRLPPERRQRIESTVGVLRAWLEAEPSATKIVIVHSGSLGGSFEMDGAQIVTHEDSLGTATALFDAEMNQIVEVVRAMRVGRLEAAGDYDAEIHDSQLARLDWHGLDADELLVATPVTVVEVPGRLGGASLPTFSAVLRSGRPIHVLVADDERVPADGSFSEYAFELGYLVIAHREAFALQATLARPGHLTRGFAEMASAVRTAIAVVSVPSSARKCPPWLQLVSGLEGRAVPTFRYDPGAGSSWAHRFDLSGNPQPEHAWPVHQVAHLDEGGAERSLECAFTFADAAALEPSLRRHFWVIPREAWSDEQVSLSELLAASERQPVLGVPYVWVLTEEGVLARAVVTRELMMGARDHMRSWHTLQELGGLDNEHVRRATAAALDGAGAAARAEREALEARHLEALEQVRAEAASEAMARLVDVLMDLDSAPRTAPRAGPQTAPAAAPAAAPPAEEAAAAPAAAPEPEEEVSFDDPWVDAPLCTTCNECTNINPALFKYNGDNQAYIADASAGTFAQLVAAAVKCPARCIHPGAPRSDDETATDELRAKAAQYN